MSAINASTSISVGLYQIRCLFLCQSRTSSIIWDKWPSNFINQEIYQKGYRYLFSCFVLFFFRPIPPSKLLVEKKSEVLHKVFSFWILTNSVMIKILHTDPDMHSAQIRSQSEQIEIPFNSPENLPFGSRTVNNAFIPPVEWIFTWQWSIQVPTASGIISTVANVSGIRSYTSPRW